MILAIETASVPTSVALVREGECLGEKFIEQQQTSSQISACIEELLNEANCSAKDITKIAISVGPGSFTGLRVGMATAKGLAYALNVPLIPISTLEALAYQYQTKNPTNNSNITPLLDARRGKVFCATFSPELEELVAPHRNLLKTLEIQKNSILITPNFLGLKEHIIKESHIKIVEINAFFVGLLAEKKPCVLNINQIAYLEPEYLINNYKNG